MLSKLSILSLATASILFASKVQSCLYYSGYGEEYQCELTAVIVDNGVKTCWINNACDGDDGLWRFTCIGANYAAIVSDGGWTVQYATPWGNFAFAPDQYWSGQLIIWEAEEYGC
jgi:hypothetical protein